ncbi:MAG TPA: ABC transporter permease, partial [Vicinamibacteria bacterium]
DLGVRPEGAFGARLTLAGDPYREASSRGAFLQEALRRVHTLPGVEAAAALSSLPVSDEVGGGWSTASFDVDGLPVPSSERPSALVVSATAEAFSALGIALVDGRGFEASEVVEGSPLAVVSESLAERYWAQGDAPGGRLRLDGGPWLRVVGVAREVREPASILGLDAKPAGQVYVPYGSRPSRTLTLVVRGGETASLASGLRRELRALDPGLPLYEMRTLTEARRRADWVARLWGQMLGWAAAVGMLLACAGVYGVAARGVARRTQEIGVRMALGADRRAVVALVLSQDLRPALHGAAVGLLLALALTRALRGLLHGVSASDPATLLASAGVLCGVAALATYLPARRAATVDPIAALRSD